MTLASPYSSLSELKPGLVIHLRADNDRFVGRQLIDNRTNSVRFSDYNEKFELLLVRDSSINSSCQFTIDSIDTNSGVITLKGNNGGYVSRRERKSYGLGNTLEAINYEIDDSCKFTILQQGQGYFVLLSNGSPWKRIDRSSVCLGGDAYNNGYQLRDIVEVVAGTIDDRCKFRIYPDSLETYQTSPEREAEMDKIAQDVAAKYRAGQL